MTTAPGKDDTLVPAMLAAWPLVRHIQRQCTKRPAVEVVRRSTGVAAEHEALHLFLYAVSEAAAMPPPPSPPPPSQPVNNATPGSSKRNEG